MKFLRRWWADVRSRWTMELVDNCLFVDVVNLRPVQLYEDAEGRQWMAQSRWGFRVLREGVSDDATTG